MASKNARLDVDIKRRRSLAVVVYTFNLNTEKKEADGTL